MIKNDQNSFPKHMVLPNSEEVQSNKGETGQVNYSNWSKAKPMTLFAFYSRNRENVRKKEKSVIVFLVSVIQANIYKSD